MKIQVLVLLAVASSLGAARATTFVVPSGALASIQDGVDAAGPGDTVQVKSGTYVENVVIGAGKDGLKLLAKGKVTIDARPMGSTGTGPGISVASDDVRIEGFVIRHPKGTNAHGVFSAGANGLTLRKLRIQHSDQDGILVTGADLTIDNCTVEFCNGGIDVTGSGATVKGTHVHQDGDQGIEIVGADATVTKCKVENIEDGNGVSITGANATISFCTVNNPDNDGFTVSGDNFTIKNNKVLSIDDDDNGIDVSNASTGLIQNNKIQDAPEGGITMSSTVNGVMVKNNVIKRSGCEDESGIEVNGDNNTLVGNSVSGGQSDGFQINGDGNMLMKNVSRDNGEDGFDVEGINNVLSGNKALKNLAEGLENNGTGTEFSKNVAKGNRTDVANDGAFAVFMGNTFSSGGDTTPPEIDD